MIPVSTNNHFTSAKKVTEIKCFLVCTDIHGTKKIKIYSLYPRYCSGETRMCHMCMKRKKGGSEYENYEWCETTNRDKTPNAHTNYDTDRCWWVKLLDLTIADILAIEIFA